MIEILRSILIVVLGCGMVGTAAAQLPPGVGYMFPPGGKAGETVEVTLGGYDWTPDMQLFVHDPRIALEVLAPPGPVIVPEPPYWFGKKARRPPFPLPRETRARLTIPADVPPGIVRWQVANANGASAAGSLIVSPTDIGAYRDDESVLRSGIRKNSNAESNASEFLRIPLLVSGQIQKIEEVDTIPFVVPAEGILANSATGQRTTLVTCAIAARQIGSPLNAVLEVRDATGRLVADAADTAGNDTALTFAATSGQAYTASVYDLDFRGDRSFVYQLSITSGPRVLAAIPAAGRRGETRSVEFAGYGVATGEAKLESVTREIAFPADARATSFAYQLETPYGQAMPFTLLVSDLPEAVEPASGPRQLMLPAAVTGVIEAPYGEDSYTASGKKGDVWSIDVAAEQIASPLDVSLAIRDAEGKELARNDDRPGSTDAALEFTVPADGEYTIVVSDSSAQSGNRAAVYRLTLQAAEPGFTLSVPQQLAAAIGGTAKLAISATRSGGFKEPIPISLAGLPAGVAVPEGLAIPANQKALSVELSVAADAAAVAGLATVVGEAKIGEQTIRRTTGPVLIATTIKPPFAVDAEGKDDVTKWPRGSTFPGAVLIEREAGFDQEIVLEMTSQQGRHRQGICGPDLLVPPGVDRILYPVYLPEWLETTRTSRMVVNGVAKVADPKGNIRYSVSRQKTRMGFLPTGALLKLAAEETERSARPGETLELGVTISRAASLAGPLRIELVDQEEGPLFKMEPCVVSADQPRAVLKVVLDATAGGEEYVARFRGTVLQGGEYPVVSETQVLVTVER